MAFGVLGLASCGSGDVPATGIIYSSEEFTVYADSVTQGGFTARAVSPTEITTDYRSPEQSGVSRFLRFRLSINSRDNELPQGKEHYVTIGADTVFTFGQALEQFDSVKAHDAGTLPNDTKWTLKVNMTPVLDSFKKHGYYVTPTNDTIYRDDFKGVWVAGSVDPLSWDFENLYGKHDRRLTDSGNGIYTVTLSLNPATERPADPTGWRVDSIPASWPRYMSDQMLVNAAFNMGLADLASDLRPDSTYRAGKEWDGVWTRDISYAIYLGLAAIDPENSMRSLYAKLKRDSRGEVIIQDTGTGGSWPVSSDRVVWALAAWEVYKMTGDASILERSLPAIENTLNDDMRVVWNKSLKLMQGEQSYLDWREQTYPRWMQPKDIFESMCLGTNVCFAEAFKVRDAMIQALPGNNVEPMWLGIDKEIANSINTNLWIPNRGYYGQYLYGGVYPILSQSVDNLGQALAVVFDVATPEMARSVIKNTPYTPYGISSVYPQLPDIKPYHNDAVWPFVQAFWNIAAAKTRNMAAVEKGLGSILRAAALFGTNKELFVAHNGDYRGTAVNSDSQLWSAAGMTAMVFRVIMGMDFRNDGISFVPMVPAALTGVKTLDGLRYRDARLTVEVSGTGENIASFSINGVKQKEHFLPDTINGDVRVAIVMDNKVPARQTINNAPQEWMPATPVIAWNSDLKGEIENYTPGMAYGITVNSTFLDQITTSEVTFVPQGIYALTDVVPVRSEEYVGFTPRPYEYVPAGALTMVPSSKMGVTGTKYIKNPQMSHRFVETSRTRSPRLDFEVTVDRAGDYFIDFRYANGCGPINTENKCALRMLFVNDAEAGAVVMPQRGYDEWLSTGFSNMLPVKLREGRNSLSLRLVIDNMNVEVNTALIEYARIIRKD